MTGQEKVDLLIQVTA